MQAEHILSLRTWLDALRGAREHFDVQSIHGGRSNLTYRVRHGEEVFVLRRPPYGHLLAGAHDVLREFSLLQSLEGTGVPIAQPVTACEDVAVLGAPFTLVGFLDGHTLRTPKDVAVLSVEARVRVARNFGGVLARLHQVEPEAVGRPRDSGLDHAERQFRVWTRQLQAEPVRPIAMLARLGEHLLSRPPRQRTVTIVHGDYRLDNVIIGRDGDVVGVLDWELWTLGDPTLDLGNALGYWLESTFELFALGDSPTADGALGTRADVVEAYLAAGGPEPADAALDWALSFGFWRYAVILEGVYRRNLAGAYGADDGDLDDWRRFAHVVPALAEIGWQLRPR